MTTFPVEKIRADFPILKEKIRNKPLVYLDNAATSLILLNTSSSLLTVFHTFTVMTMPMFIVVCIRLV